jgi:hypothetical protein
MPISKWVLVNVDITMQVTGAQEDSKEKFNVQSITSYQQTSSINRKKVQNFAAGIPWSDGVLVHMEMGKYCGLQSYDVQSGLHKTPPSNENRGADKRTMFVKGKYHYDTERSFHLLF